MVKNSTRTHAQTDTEKKTKEKMDSSSNKPVHPSDLRSILKEKHAQMETMKEQLKDPNKKKSGILGANAGANGNSGQSVKSPPMWKVVLVVVIVSLMSLASNQFRSAEKESRGNRSDAEHIDPNRPTRKWGSAMNFERADGKKWSTERILKHFHVKNPSELVFSKPSTTFDEFIEAIEDPSSHIVTLDVSRSVTHDSKTGKQYEVPVISKSSYIPVSKAKGGMTFDDAVNAFIRMATQKGLHIRFHDPRIFKAALRMLDMEVDYGRLPGPLLIEAEVLPGPEAVLPEMSCQMLYPETYPGGQPPKNLKAVQVSSLTDGTIVVPFDPVSFVGAVFDHVPGAILMLGVATMHSCDYEVVIPRPGPSQGEQLGSFLGEDGIELTPEENAEIDQDELMRVIKHTANAMIGDDGRGRIGKSALDEVSWKTKGNGENRKLLQLDALNQLSVEETELVALKDLSYPSRVVQFSDFPTGYGEYDVHAAAKQLQMTKGLSWDTGSDVMALLNNGTFTGDVWFPISACYLGKGGTHPGYLSELTATKLGYIIFLHGPIMWSDADVRDTLRKELDSGKTAFAGDFNNLPYGDYIERMEVFYNLEPPAPVAREPEKKKKGKKG